jgi:hypothetical protein
MKSRRLMLTLAILQGFVSTVVVDQGCIQDAGYMAKRRQGVRRHRLGGVFHRQDEFAAFARMQPDTRQFQESLGYRGGILRPGFYNTTADIHSLTSLQSTPSQLAGPCVDAGGHPRTTLLMAPTGQIALQAAAGTVPRAPLGPDQRAPRSGPRNMLAATRSRILDPHQALQGLRGKHDLDQSEP